jgi:hypothetical protein
MNIYIYIYIYIYIFTPKQKILFSLFPPKQEHLSSFLPVLKRKKKSNARNNDISSFIRVIT